LYAILREKHCQCTNGLALKLSTTDTGIQKKLKDEIGDYVFEGGLHEGKPYYVKRTPGTQPLFLYWNPKENTWWIGEDLRGKSAELKMEKNANTGCPGDLTSKQWEKKGFFSWSKVPSLKLVCVPDTSVGGSGGISQGPSRPGTPTSGGSHSSTGGYRPPTGTITSGGSSDLTNTLKSKGCKCHDTPFINFTSTDSRTQRKHLNELGKYEFKGQIHNDRPVYEKKVGIKTYYTYFEKNDKTWWIGEDLLGRDALMKMEDKINLVCPADPRTTDTGHWERKNSFGFWSRDKSMRAQCG
jgi:hypothetical protein